MSDEHRDIVKPGELGEGPESRMRNYPRKKPTKSEVMTGTPPGAAKPATADAIGEGDADELAENADDATIRLREAEEERQDAERKKRGGQAGG